MRRERRQGSKDFGSQGSMLSTNNIWSAVFQFAMVWAEMPSRHLYWPPRLVNVLRTSLRKRPKQNRADINTLGHCTDCQFIHISHYFSTSTGITAAGITPTFSHIHDPGRRNEQETLRTADQRHQRLRRSLLEQSNINLHDPHQGPRLLSRM